MNGMKFRETAGYLRHHPQNAVGAASEERGACGADDLAGEGFERGCIGEVVTSAKPSLRSRQARAASVR
jgi:hypothetical protein